MGVRSLHLGDLDVELKIVIYVLFAMHAGALVSKLRTRDRHARALAFITDCVCCACLGAQGFWLFTLFRPKRRTHVD